VKRLAALAFALLAPLFASAQYNSYTNYASGTAPSFEGLWWNPAESGWGLSIAHQGDMVFAVWYTFDRDGSPAWFVMPEARLMNDMMGDMTGMGDMEMMMGMSIDPPTFTGLLYRPSMATGKLVMTEVGSGTVMFRDRNTAVFGYSVGNVAGAKRISKMVYGVQAPSCTIGGAKGATDNYQDLWFNPADSGWGVSIAHQGDIIFGTYFTYDASGRAEWFVVPDAMKSGAGTYSGTLARATGPSYDAAWDSSKVHVAAVGSGTFRFDAPGASFNAVRGGVAQSRPMQRMQFAAPATVCR
jgi:hypothetical protein